MQSSELEMVIRLFLFDFLKFCIRPDICIRFDVLSNIRYPVGCLARCRVSGRILNSVSRMIFVPQRVFIRFCGIWLDFGLNIRPGQISCIRLDIDFSVRNRYLDGYFTGYGVSGLIFGWPVWRPILYPVYPCATWNRKLGINRGNKF